MFVNSKCPPALSPALQRNALQLAILLCMVTTPILGDPQGTTLLILGLEDFLARGMSSTSKNNSQV